MLTNLSFKKKALPKKYYAMYTIKKIVALFCIVAILVCIVPSSSAGTDAKIVITGVKPTELSPGDTKEITLTVKNGGSNDAKQIVFNFQESQYISVIGSSSVYINWIDGVVFQGCGYHSSRFRGGSRWDIFHPCNMHIQSVLL